MANLDVRKATVAFGRVDAVFDASVDVAAGSMTALVGPNAAGKSSLLAYITGRCKGGSEGLTLDGVPLQNLTPRDRIAHGLVLVPQGRLLFPRLTVAENLQVVADALRLSASAISAATDRFPILTERWNARTGSLSGGEQQMLAIARGLMCSPRTLLLDEPTLGLAPKVVAEVMSVVAELCAEGVGVLIAEPVMDNVPPAVTKGWVMLRGRTVAAASSRTDLARAYSQVVGLGAVALEDPHA
jgi:branched-chain amino acid transport system ATP-binding protein